MVHRSSERGQALIIIAIAVIGLFAFAALAIDGTRIYSDKRHAQNAADTSALAGALAAIRCSTGTPPGPCSAAQALQAAETAARARATTNGYTNDTKTSGPNTKVVFGQCPTSAAGASDPVTGLWMPYCAGVEAGHESEYIRVWIISTIPATFGRVIGRQTITTAAEAIVRVQGSTSSGSGKPWGDAGMVSTKNGPTDKCLMMNGGGNLYMHGSGIDINCTNSKAWWMDGSANLTLEKPGNVAGCFYENGSVNLTGSINCNKSATTYSAASFASVPTMPNPVPTCGGPGGVVSGATPTYNGSIPSVTVKQGNTAVLNPGTWGDIIVEGNSIAKMNAGTYCFNGNLTVKSDLLTRNSNGTVQIVFNNAAGSFLVDGGGTVNFVDNGGMEIYGKNGDLTLNSSAIFRAKPLRIFMSGSGNVIVNSSQGTLISDDAYIYLKNGDIEWNSSSTITLKAPSSGIYKGLLVYKPWGTNPPQDQATQFNGGSNVHLIGTFLAPTTDITYNGGTNWELHSQVIASTFLVNGNADVDIYYVATENYNPGTTVKPTIQLTK